MSSDSIFREYIGLKPGLAGFPDDIINPNVKEFHFILAFATEQYDKTTETGNGTFTPKWDRTIFNVQSIEKLKNKHKNAKVVISIGGRGSQYPFNPALKWEWVENATKSLQKILNHFNKLIDGIDVNYENIKVSDDDFSDCIGNLIKSLKGADYIKVASIAPSHAANLPYKKLYQNFGDNIDWVGYQFYDQKVFNIQAFKSLYDHLTIDYPNTKLLAGFSTDPNDAGNITRDVFFEGCVYLLKKRLLPGIFIWFAEDSGPLGYQDETHAQNILVNP